MTPRFPRLLLTALCLLAAGGSAAAQIAYPPSYKIHDLGVLPGCQSSHAYGINDALQIVGDSHDAVTNVMHAVRWQAGSMIDIGALPGGKTVSAMGINASGTIAGTSEMNPTGFYSTESAFVFDGNMTALGPPPGYSGFNTRGKDIAKNGAVVGSSPFDPSLSMKAALWLPGASAPVSLGGLSSAGPSEAFGVNSNGWVVGQATALGGMHAFVWAGTSMADLGTLGGPIGNSKATDINDFNQVVGEADGPGFSHAFFWSGGVMVDLGTLGPNLQFSRANAINNSVRIVGTGNTFSSNWHAILWHAGVTYDLNQLVTPANHGWVLISAEDINQKGYIVGYGIPPGLANIHGFLLEPRPQIVTPVPVLSHPPVALHFHL